jgi:hypothetical protein
MGKPLPHGALGIDGGAPAPPLELLPPEPPLDAELLVFATAIAFQEHHLSAGLIGQSRRDRLTDWSL